MLHQRPPVGRLRVGALKRWRVSRILGGERYPGERKEGSVQHEGLEAHDRGDLALALVASGCGGGKKDDSSAGTAATTASGSGSPEAILNSISTNTSATGPQKITVNLKVGVNGDPKDPSVAAFLSKPVTLTVDGSTDGTAKKTDLTFSVAAGPLAFNGEVRQLGNQAWLELNGKWYTLPADALSSSSGGTGTTTTGGTSKIDAQRSSPHSASPARSSRTRSSTAPRTSAA